ncbi:ricin B lectin domain-containing protein [Amanita rubescens]|nr:ricin B lectin domain-containing protein [Amanita rubescens]
MLPHNGTYEIVNVDTGSYFDLKGGSAAPDTNIIGYPRTGGINQKWVLEREGNLITLYSLLSQGGVTVKAHVPGSEVVIRPRREQFELIEERTGLYRIKVIGENLFMRLENGAPLTPVTINFNGLANDVWRFDREPVR